MLIYKPLIGFVYIYPFVDFNLYFFQRCSEFERATDLLCLGCCAVYLRDCSYYPVLQTEGIVYMIKLF